MNTPGPAPKDGPSIHEQRYPLPRDHCRVPPNHPPGVEIRKEPDMNTITCPIRTRVSEWVIRTLGCAIMASTRSLLAASVSPMDINAMFRGSLPDGHADTVTERLLVLQVLEQPERSRSLVELEVALSDIEPIAISDALSCLEAEDVLFACGELVWASPCVRHLDALGLISL